MNVLELFAGIGGIGLGLERAGMSVVGQVEIDPYCRRVLARHWPEVPRHDDVRTCIDWWRSGTRPYVDLIAGGFPCQDISVAGRAAGIVEGTRSSLWSYMADVVRVLRPRYVLVENVAALLARGLDVVLADLAACGYDAEWDCIPASAVGAPHRRDRVWLVAYPQRHPVRVEPVPIFRGRGPAVAGHDGKDGHVADAADATAEVSSSDGAQRGRRATAQRWTEQPAGSGAGGRAVDGDRPPRVRWDSAGGAADAPAPVLADPDSAAAVGSPVTRPERDPWAAEPDVGRVAHGIPARVDRLRALGNAVVPQVAEHVGRLILAHDARQTLVVQSSP
jgi:DNA (cytosine-5)-methyltransferase 1